jgi:DNA-binding NtrC family response regulator
MADAGARPSLLVVDDDVYLAEQLRWALKDDHQVTVANDRVRGLAALAEVKPDLVLVDLCLPPDNVPDEGFRILNAARAAGRGTMVIMMSGLEEREAALRAVAEGAYDFFQKPFDIPTLRVVVGRALERQALEKENRRLREELRDRFHFNGIIGVSAPMQRVLDAIRRVADSPVTVCLTGESGTGKEVVARAIHYSGGRREAPFMAVHCGALPETLLEAELFGHEKGAFTGAVTTRLGRFEAADGGTLFLDEIACLPASTQMKLLRVLEERTVERLGSNRSRPVDIRLIAATNEDLEAKVRRGEFREDLFFRINVFPILIPPLRDRREDIPLLAEYFLRRTSEARGAVSKRFGAGVKEALAARTWRGNVRELLNLVETVALLSDGDTIELASLPPAPAAAGAASRGSPAAAGGGSAEGDGAVDLKVALQSYERRLLVEAIERCRGVKAQAARELGLDPSQMKYLVRKHGL